GGAGCSRRRDAGRRRTGRNRRRDAGGGRTGRSCRARDRGAGGCGMTEITAGMVKQLRDATSAGMMECKRALQETDGDFDEAVKLLRERGMASAAKRAARGPSEGRLSVISRDAVAAIAAVVCETDPVSNNDDFLAYAEKV